MRIAQGFRIKKKDIIAVVRRIYKWYNGIGIPFKIWHLLHGTIQKWRK